LSLRRTQNMAHRRLYPALPHDHSHGIRQLDEVIVTHPHRDHLDDIFNFDLLEPRVLRRPRHLSELEIRAGNLPGDSRVLDKYFEIDRRYSGPVPASNDPEAPLNNGGARITSFLSITPARSNLNNHSFVTFITYAGSTICLPGDNESPSWRELLENPHFCHHLTLTNVLVAAHHGREAGYCEDIFEFCSPKLVVVSDGPLADTSAISKYYEKAIGWPVASRSDGSVSQRYVLTTRKDGVIVAECGIESGRSYLDVSVE
jgi:hypothetical protein